MPYSSFDSLAMPKPKKKWRVTKKNHNPYVLKHIKGMNDLHKMIANPAVQSLQKRLKECYRKLNKTKMAVTKTEHQSPRRSTRRSVRRSSRRRSPKRSRRRSVRRSPKRSRRRSVRRAPRRRRRSVRSYRHMDPIAWARLRAREKNRGY